MRGLLFVALWVWALPVLAQTRTLDQGLSVPDGADCLTHDALVEHTEAWLGTDLLQPRQTILIDLGQGERFQVGFVLLDGDETRARRSFARLPEACADRRAALSLGLAIALDASLLDRLVGPRPAATADVVSHAPDSTPPPPPEVASAPPEDRPRQAATALGLQVGLSTGLAAGLLPRLSPWGSLDLVLRGRGFSLRGLVGATPRQRSSLAEAKVQTQLVFGGVEACLDRAVHRMAWAGCLGPRLGRLYAEGQGFAVSLSTLLWWVDLSAGLSMRWPRDSALSLRLGLAGQLTLVRPELRVTDASGALVFRESLPLAGFMATGGVVVSLR